MTELEVKLEFNHLWHVWRLLCALGHKYPDGSSMRKRIIEQACAQERKAIVYFQNHRDILWNV